MMHHPGSRAPRPLPRDTRCHSCRSDEARSLEGVLAPWRRFRPGTPKAQAAISWQTTSIFCPSGPMTKRAVRIAGLCSIREIDIYCKKNRMTRVTRKITTTAIAIDFAKRTTVAWLFRAWTVACWGCSLFVTRAPDIRVVLRPQPPADVRQVPLYEECRSRGKQGLVSRSRPLRHRPSGGPFPRCFHAIIPP
jgi:hypothetical protein